MTEKLERAVSIRQPYVELILIGKKRAEHRSRPTRIRGRVYLYASLQPGDHAWAARTYRVRCDPEKLTTGRVVGSVEIVGGVDRGDCYWWRLANPRRYRVQLKPRNQPQPSFWKPKF